MARLRNRRGAVLVMASFIIVLLVLMMAFAMDLSQMYVQVNQEQAAADAAAHAGAIELVVGDSNNVKDTALLYSGRNSILTHQAAFQKANVTCGTWDPSTSTFSSSALSASCGDSANAVRVVGTDTSQYIFARVWNVANLNLTRSAVAWVAPGVLTSDCVKPWSIPYWTLTKRLDPTNPDSTRDLNATDLANLAAFTPAQLTFNLKQNNKNPFGPGNYLPVDIDGAGGSLYRQDIWGCSTTPVGPGTILDTETGNMVGPTVQGADSLCQPHYKNGACGDGKGGVGVIIKAPLWISYSSTMNGKSQVQVKIIGSFSLDTVRKDASVTGHFLRSVDQGSLTTGKGTLVRVILVQ